MTLALAALLGLALGSIPFGLLLTRAAGLGDVRRIGSGNIGATNVLRTGRKDLAAATLLLDGGKGAAAVLLAGAWLGPLAAPVAGVAAVVGHMFTPWLGFAGGKGVATGLGVLIGAAWPVGLAACATWLAVAAVARISSLAALVSFAAAPLYAAALADRWTAAAAMAIAALVYVRHAGNIRRLRAGTEPRIGERR
ncbi:glycerol-3-phosphate 1-O-acyltransferase PlsY [Elioraea sp. Yellowstone]|jgi:glycerol-3-phosphate acyltransferase PlsY|uniref:glycerol-3-phosphate 1-O-acyltransferase PlsY n=1 Tax=Elioraea sp. Yellowstone TaxID=2592070 RepID=UPI0011530696|nr:glycerol-3-phosphate 1-O-acyltransferase PlsY [Elioraea sp. Yellowstone]TQF76364.1 glycerol-3-phosphate 1-O-acyltransferase PlsY [Elioraea sp. Yellowstone]